MIDYSFLQTPTPAEISRLVQLYRHAGWWKEEADDPELVSAIVSGSHCFLVARQTDTIVAMGRAISDRVSDAYIQDVTVDKAFQGRKIGSTIIRKLIDHLHADGLAWIGLIAENNSQAFYEPLGFQKMPNSVPMLNQTS